MKNKHHHSTQTYKEKKIDLRQRNKGEENRWIDTNQNIGTT